MCISLTQYCLIDGYNEHQTFYTQACDHHVIQVNASVQAIRQRK